MIYPFNEKTCCKNNISKNDEEDDCEEKEVSKRCFFLDLATPFFKEYEVMKFDERYH